VNRQNACVETATSIEALGSSQATFRGGGGLLLNLSQLRHRDRISRDRAIEPPNKVSRARRSTATFRHHAVTSSMFMAL
jgi:hypothetical protein